MQTVRMSGYADTPSPVQRQEEYYLKLERAKRQTGEV